MTLLRARLCAVLLATSLAPAQPARAQAGGVTLPWGPAPAATAPLSEPADPFPRFSVLPFAFFSAPVLRGQRGGGAGISIGGVVPGTANRVSIEAELAGAQGSTSGTQSLLDGPQTFSADAFTLDTIRAQVGASAIWRFDDALGPRRSLLVGAGPDLIFAHDSLSRTSGDRDAKWMSAGVHASLAFEYANVGPGSPWFETRFGVARASPLGEQRGVAGSLRFSAGYRVWFR
jgi:hypothetical protein